jgi:CRISPR-associated exonuclease Cas4
MVMNAAQTSLSPLRIHDLKQWAYCPRIVFYNHIMPVESKPTYKMEHGREAEDAIDRLERRRKLSEFGLSDGTRRFHVLCTSERLEISGRLDLLIESPDGIFPVDFKDTEQRVHQNHITQLCGYALLLEERYERPVNRGFIFLIPRDEIVAIQLTPERKAQTLGMLTAIRDALSRQLTPEPTNVRSRCEECEYRNFCADVF